MASPSHVHGLRATAVRGEQFILGFALFVYEILLEATRKTDINNLAKLANSFVTPEMSFLFFFFLGKAFEQDLSVDMLILSH